jgi:hypothetical protein
MWINGCACSKWMMMKRDHPWVPKSPATPCQSNPAVALRQHPVGCSKSPLFDGPEW